MENSYSGIRHLTYINEPSSLEVADFVGEGVFLPGKVISEDTVETAIGNISGHIKNGFQNGDVVKVLIRPDDILHDDDSAMTAVVKDKAFRGAEFLYTLELDDGQELLSLVPSHHNHPLNEPIGIRLEIDHLVIFPPNGKK